MHKLNNFENFLIRYNNKFYLILLPGILIIYLYPFMWKALLVIMVFGIGGMLETLSKIEKEWQKYLKFYHYVLIYVIIPLPFLFEFLSFFIKVKILKIPFMVITTSIEEGVKFLSSNPMNLIFFMMFLISIYFGSQAMCFYFLKMWRDKV